MKLPRTLALVGTLATLPVAGRADDQWQGHLRYGSIDFTPKDAVAITAHGQSSLLLADFTLDRQAIASAYDPMSLLREAERAGRGHFVAVWANPDGGCMVNADLLNRDLRERALFNAGFLTDGGRLRGECHGRSSPQESPALEFSFSADLPLIVVGEPAPLDPKSSGVAAAVDALLGALNRGDWDAARAYLPDNATPPSFASPEAKDRFFRGLAASYPARMVLEEARLKGDQVRARFSGATRDGRPITRGDVTLLKVGGTWRVLRPLFSERFVDTTARD